MPVYQASAPPALNVINSGSSGAPCTAAAGFCREVPDVSANSDPYTGYAIYFAGSWLSIGGTSAAAPTWAALLALANASPVCAGIPVGFANSALYRAAGSLYATTFNDVLFGNNVVASGLGLSAASGYDMASGLGTPNGANLSLAICDRVTVSSPGDQTLVEGALSSLRISATSAAGASQMFLAAGLPPGLSLSPATGLISGTPTRTGLFKVTVGARDADGALGVVSFNWTVAAASVRFPQRETRFGTVGKRTSLALRATINNGRSPSYAVRGLPLGLSLNRRTGLISGTPARVGRYEVAATASDTTGTTAGTHFSWRIGGPPSAHTTALTGVTSGKLTLTSRLAAGLGAGPVAVISLSLPPGLSYRAAHGRVRGVALSGSGGRHVRFSQRLSHGSLMLALRRPVRFVRVTLTSPGLQASAGLTRQVASGHVSNRTIRLAVTDSHQLSTTMRVSLRIA